jgi:hypothetical protein
MDIEIDSIEGGGFPDKVEVEAGNTHITIINKGTTMKTKVLPPEDAGAFTQESIWPNQEERVVDVEIVDHISESAIDVTDVDMEKVQEVAELVANVAAGLLLKINLSKEVVTEVLSNREGFVKSVISQVTPALRLHFERP